MSIGFKANVDGTADVLIDGVAVAKFNSTGLVKKPGEVLQQQGIDYGTASTTSTAFVALTSAVSITPRSTASVLIVRVTFAGGYGSVAGVNAAARFALYETTGTPTIVSGDTGVAYDTSAGGVGGFSALAITSFRLGNTALIPRSFKLYGKAVGGANAVANAASITVEEIQA